MRLLPLLALFPLLVSAAEPVSLFDGKTLKGWDGETTKVWRVQDGVIVGGSLEGNPQNEFLATAQSYRNFRLTLEYKLTGTEGFVNGGVQFRSQRIAEPPNEMMGYQADIGAGYSGCLYDESRRKTMLAKPEAAVIQQAEKPGEWNRYEIRAADERIQLFVNGVRTVNYTEASPGIPLEGRIALQDKLDGFRIIRHEHRPGELNYAVLSGANLSGAQMAGAVAMSSDFTDANLLEIFDVRAMLEGYGASLAALRASKEEIAGMRQEAEAFLALARKKGPPDMRLIAESNNRLHRLILDAGKNQRLASMMVAVVHIPLVKQTFAKYTREALERSANQHMDLVSAIAAGDAVWAEAAMRAHIHAAKKVIFGLESGAASREPSQRQTPS